MIACPTRLRPPRVVEVLNEVLRQPNVKAADAAASTSPAVSFDTPDGKRLIVETIAFQASRPESDAAASNRMLMNPLVDGVRALVPLAVQFISEDGYLISIFPFPMRLDSAPGSNNELQFRRGSGSPGTLNVAMFGCSIDL